MKTMLSQVVAKRALIAGLSVLLIAGALMLRASLSTSSENTLDPQSVAASFKKSYESEYSGKYDSAIKAMSTVVKEYSDDYTVNLRMGWLNYLDGKYEDAVEYYRAAIEAEPDSIEARVGVMLPLLALQQYDDVENAAYQVLKKDDNNYYASLRLVTALRLNGKFETAEEAAREMLVLYPSDVTFLAELAAIMDGQGDAQSARDICWKIRVLDPTNATAEYYLSQEK